jgi:hypothetical protein
MEQLSGGPFIKSQLPLEVLAWRDQHYLPIEIDSKVVIPSFKLKLNFSLQHVPLILWSSATESSSLLVAVYEGDNDWVMVG